MKILIAQPWISYRGAETVSVLQAYYLNQAGHQAKIACLFVDRGRLPPRGDQVQYILPPRSLSEFLRGSKLAFLVLGFPMLFFLVWANARQFDFLNPHNLPSTWVCTLVSALTKKPSIWTAHGVPKKSDIFGGFFEAVAWVLGASVLDKWAVGKMAKIIAVSEKVARDIERHYERKAEVLYPVIESNFYSAGDGKKIREKFGIGTEDFVLLHLSRLHPAKEPEVSLEAFAEVAEKIPSARLIIAGEGPLGKRIKSKVKSQKLGGRVIMAGFVEPKEVKDYYAAADLVLVPYWKTEGCSLTPFEALGAGKVSIVARGSGADEIIEKGFGLVSDPNPRAFASNILWAYHHQGEIRKMGERGRSYVAQKLSGEAYAKAFLQAI